MTNIETIRDFLQEHGGSTDVSVGGRYACARLDNDPLPKSSTFHIVARDGAELRGEVDLPTRPHWIALYRRIVDAGGRFSDQRQLAKALDREPINWHLTWSGNGPALCGTTDMAPGFYPRTSEPDRRADFVVAPGEFVDRYFAERDPGGEYEGTRDDAVRAWARENGLPCG